jgi:hypothetical protein
MASFAARHSSLLVAALVPLAERTEDDSSLRQVAPSLDLDLDPQLADVSSLVAEVCEVLSTLFRTPHSTL